MKNKWMIMIVILIVLAVIGTTVGVSLAVWRSRPVTKQDVPVPTDDYNPSEKHIKYHALDADGEFTSGTAVSYAAVGYDGLVDVVEIPSTYNDKPITAIMFDPSQVDVRFANNVVIRELIVPASVDYIAEGVFVNCVYLQKVSIEGTGALFIGEHAFAGCSELSSFSTIREITCPGTYLFGTKIG